MRGQVLLGIDSSAGLSVAVLGGRAATATAAERFEPRPTVHAEQLSGLIAATCRDAGIALGALTGVVVGTGPAPFTGLRVGLMTARVLADALGVPVSGVCSLDALAQQVLTADPGATPAEFLVATDARRREVYWARYSGPEGTRIDGPGVAAPAAVAADAPGVPVFGAGTALYPAVFGTVREPLAVSAAAMLRGVLSGVVPVADPEPRYLRRPDVSPSTVSPPATGGR